MLEIVKKESFFREFDRKSRLGKYGTCIFYKARTDNMECGK